MDKTWVRVVYSICWIITAIEYYAVCLFPCYYLLDWGNSLPLIGQLLFYPAMFFLFLFNTILLSGCVRSLFIPELKEGVYDLAKEPKVLVTWYANRFLVEMIMLPFQRIIFANAVLRYVCLKFLGAKIHFSTTISSNRVNDFHLISVGKATTIGAWAVLYSHIQPNERQLIVSRTSVGDNCFIGGEALLGVGSKTGNNVLLGYRGVIGMLSKVDDNCNIGWAANIGTKCTIGKNVTIGKYASLGSKVVVADGIKIPDFALVPDRVVVDSQEMADSFIPQINRLENVD